MSRNPTDQYRNFIEPNFRNVPEVSPCSDRQLFQRFCDECLDQIPEGSPADGYLYASHMGEFVRLLKQAQGSFTNAKLAFYAARGSEEE
jgi:hypothetical protein